MHDVAERWTGDVPATTKWENPHLAEGLRAVEHKVEVLLGIRYDLADEEAIILKTADMLELCFWCARQISMGNRNFRQVFVNGDTWLMKHGLNCDAVDQILNKLRKQVYHG